MLMGLIRDLSLNLSIYIQNLRHLADGQTQSDVVKWFEVSMNDCINTGSPGHRLSLKLSWEDKQLKRKTSWYVRKRAKARKEVAEIIGVLRVGS